MYDMIDMAHNKHYDNGFICMDRDSVDLARHIVLFGVQNTYLFKTVLFNQ